jgi:hypothetical protein
VKRRDRGHERVAHRSEVGSRAARDDNIVADAIS